MNEFDTIAAISTPISSEGGIGVIRISGPEAIEVADKIYRGKQRLCDVPSHTVHYGHIYDDEDMIDEVMVSVFFAPKTYTREDVVEISCHGSIFLLRRVLSCVLKNGARPADPGEFTKRAFLNGRIDLSQAESVMDLISSENEMAVKNSLSHLSGAMSTKISSIREGILFETARIESALDDPEHYDLSGYSEELSKKLSEWKDVLSDLIDSADDGATIRDGISTLILGRPNVGKSSLFNLLVNKEAAIVTSIPGTTRDVVEEKISFGDFSLRLMDTAGIRHTEDTVEKIGVKKALSLIDDASLIIYVVDGSEALDDDDHDIMERIRDKNVIVLLNKSDLTQVVSEDDIRGFFDGNLSEKSIISFSSKDMLGISSLKDEISRLFFKGEVENSDRLYITNERQKFELINALGSVKRVNESIASGLPEDFYTVDLMDAYSALGSIIGESISDDLVDEIFSKFCMGK
ncbi:MAG: tRNA uridine-5-carboxymethylaminomethyl(34) synthesis GTPase MnmE [Lachnospiraceae bacterium]|nr:tRNA uridine-5-carboxymethylaminomethyl(34) synthesis GTPase MnmE [Lachnospiraceae bacterium]